MVRNVSRYIKNEAQGCIISGHKRYAYSFIIYLCLHVLNVILNMYLLDIFIDGEFLDLGSRFVSLTYCFRTHQQNLKMQWKRLLDFKRLYETRCREEVASNQFYHQEISRLGKSSREAEKVMVKLFRSQLQQADIIMIWPFLF